jgi:hypothetical protein
MATVPLKNVTLPVGRGELVVSPDTVAVNVTACPVAEGFAEDISVVTVW